jgi:hypothetical protein
MFYSPESIMDFGVNKGHPVKLIYKYYPDYLKWLIMNAKDFFIEIEVFKCLSCPTPFLNDSNIQMDYILICQKYYDELYSPEILKKKLSKDDKTKLFEAANNKKDEYFDTANMKAFNNISFALNVLKKLKKEPKEKHFLFGDECIGKNTKNKGFIMTEALYERQNKNVQIWKENTIRLPKKLRESEELEIQSLIEWEDDISDAIYNQR